MTYRNTLSKRLFSTAILFLLISVPAFKSQAQLTHLPGYRANTMPVEFNDPANRFGFLYQSGSGLEIAVFDNWPPTTGITTIRPSGWDIQLSEYKKHGNVDGTPLIPFNDKLYFDASNGSGV